jgi:hypothetical protein
MIHSDIVTAAALNRPGYIRLQFINTGNDNLVVEAETPLGVISSLPTSVEINALNISENCGEPQIVNDRSQK